MELYRLREPGMDDIAMMKEFRKDYWINLENNFYETTFLHGIDLKPNIQF